ncbi:MAG: DEAD/DEAH box helicase family protein [Oscillospiraceae bacterium]|nr:DEAD/DEAH box helicase family protein [Oscillospiraceae bacterium]
MFYKMIEAKRDQWYRSADCTVGSLISYMEDAGGLRDAQIDAIKTYLFLKIACVSKPLWKLFAAGAFNTCDLDAAELSSPVRAYLQSNPAAAALYEYACQKNDNGEQVSATLETAIKEAPDSIDYAGVFKKLFYDVSYTDYLFSLPMGAGKTYLMAAFIYLDLYFAQNEPHNPAFAHNFIIFAPSGLKSSVVPSLKTIRNFDPSWVLPEPAASEIKRKIAFEVLDQNRSEKKSNKTKNPNVQKIANHQPLSDMFGLVAVTNAEKVILDRLDEDKDQLIIPELQDPDWRLANELRNLIGSIPSLSIFIDEVHHAVSNADKDQERKLRSVVNRWMQGGTVNSVIGFSGTPYLARAERVKITDALTVGTSEISNIVYYYPLKSGIGNFLKRPVVKIAEIADSSRIIENGVRAFLDTYKDKVYADGTTAKLGIYCGTIEKLEELVYPIVSGIAAEYGLGSSSILRFYRESSSKDKTKKKYVAPADSQMLFDTLDKPISPIRIILLVQIGKEGWDCRSLTGIILSQEGDCPTNMVLQTSCRCLRQVEKGQPETALIYLNSDNAEVLNTQLQQQQHITLKEFADADNRVFFLKRYNRTAYLKLPKIDFYQLKVEYETLTVETAAPAKHIPHAADTAKLQRDIIRTTDLQMEHYTTSFDDTERGTEQATFNSWLYWIAKGSFGTLTMAELNAYRPLLQQAYETVTYENKGIRYYSSRYDHTAVESHIRKAFCDKRDFTTKEELIPQNAALLNIANFTPEIRTSDTAAYYPAQEVVEKIILDDQGKLKVDKKTQQMIALAEETGNTAIADMLRRQNSSHPQKDRSFHYLPYHTDSAFEKTFMDEILSFEELERIGLEIYYNGDRAMTEFKIKCYKRAGGKWQYIGMYTPDFLIIKRKDGAIYKAVIVETKGAGFEKDFEEKKAFVETAFLQRNNEQFGYQRFDFLYLPDTLSQSERLSKTFDKICAYFGE